MAEHDVGTTDTAVSGLGGTADFQIDSDDNTVYVDESAVFDATATGVVIASSAAISAFLYIKHTGFTSSAKSTATTQLLKVGVGDPDAVGFSLSAGEAITLHGFGTSTDDINNWKLESASGDIYVEVLYF
jgi:Tfp pilus assembly protein PilW